MSQGTLTWYPDPAQPPMQFHWRDGEWSFTLPEWLQGLPARLFRGYTEDAEREPPAPGYHVHEAEEMLLRLARVLRRDTSIEVVALPFRREDPSIIQ